MKRNESYDVKNDALARRPITAYVEKMFNGVCPESPAELALHICDVTDVVVSTAYDRFSIPGEGLGDSTLVAIAGTIKIPFFGPNDGEAAAAFILTNKRARDNNSCN